MGEDMGRSKMKASYAHLFSMAIILFTATIMLNTLVSAAQLGEVAGQPHFNVTLGGSNSIVITVVSRPSYPYALPVKVILPTLTTKDAETITPVVTASPMEGVVPPGGYFQVNVTVNMPAGINRPGYNWTGIMQVVTVPGNSSEGTSIPDTGVAKIVTITAIAPTPSASSYIDLTEWILIIIVLVVIGAIYYYFRWKSLKSKK